MKRSYASYPLRLHNLLKSNSIWGYISNYGGGVVSGDIVSVKISVAKNSNLVFTAQSTQKVFKSVGGKESKIYQDVCVEDDGFLALVPQPTTVFEGALFSQATEVQLYPNANLLLCTWYTGGRGESQDGTWNFKSFGDCTVLRRCGKLIYRDAMKLNGEDDLLAEHMARGGGYGVAGTVLLVGSKLDSVAKALLEKFCSRGTLPFGMESEMNVACACSKRSGVFALRLAARSFEHAASFLHEQFGSTLQSLVGSCPFLDMLGNHRGVVSSHIPSMGIRKTRLPQKTDLGPKPQHYVSEEEPTPMCLWQLIDASLPTGGFAHSQGLEAAWRVGCIKSGFDLEAEILARVEQTKTSLLPFLLKSHFECKRMKVDWLKRLEALDSSLGCSISTAVARRASLAQGRALLRVARTCFFSENPDFESLYSKIKKTFVGSSSDENDGIGSGHGCIVFGCVASMLGLGPRLTSKAFLYTVLRDMISAAIRINLLGSMEGAKLQYELQKRIDSYVPDLDAHYNDIGENEIVYSYQQYPMIDIVAGIHERLNSRIYMS